jgi:chaperonin GroES
LNDKGDRVSPEVNMGDKILFGKYSGTEVTVGDDSYLIMRESDILAVL